MNILNDIIADKKVEIAAIKALQPIKVLERSSLFPRQTYSLKDSLKPISGFGLIAEFKRKSPSKGALNNTALVSDTTKSYMAAGATALSVLTNKTFFGGSNEDLLMARASNKCPILRKDFILDEYQIIEAKAIGADAILLIAAMLHKKQVKSFSTLAHSIGLEVLLEVHEEHELDFLNPEIDVVGINNRSLKSFETSIQTSISLSSLIPSCFKKISESGIRSSEEAFLLQQNGFDGFLIGEQFMKQRDPGAACQSFIHSLKQMYHAS